MSAENICLPSCAQLFKSDLSSLNPSPFSTEIGKIASKSYASEYFEIIGRRLFFNCINLIDQKNGLCFTIFKSFNYSSSCFPIFVYRLNYQKYQVDTAETASYDFSHMTVQVVLPLFKPGVSQKTN